MQGTKIDVPIPPLPTDLLYDQAEYVYQKQEEQHKDGDGRKNVDHLFSSSSNSSSSVNSSAVSEV